MQTEDAINSNTLMEYATKCSENIADSIALICESLSPGVLINLESLLILDIQGKTALMNTASTFPKMEMYLLRQKYSMNNLLAGAR